MESPHKLQASQSWRRDDGVTKFFDAVFTQVTHPYKETHP